MKAYRRLALATTVSTLALVAVGGLVRATKSGLGCLDEWPLCHGGWIAPARYHAIIEYSHRLLAAIVVVLVIWLAVAARRQPAVLRRWSYATVGVVLFQAALGAVVVRRDLHAAIVTAHFAAAMALVLASVRVTAGTFTHGRAPAMGDERRLWRMALGAAAGIFGVLLIGTLVRERGAGLAFGDWPLMGGRAVPRFGTVHHVLQFGHRIFAALVFGHVVATALRARRDARPDVRALALWTAGLYAAQVAAGAANVWTRLAPAAVLAHVAGAGLVWASAVALVVTARASAAGAEPRAPSRVLPYVRLTKPRIIVLLLVTTVPAMVIADGGFPSVWLVAATLIGGTLTAGSANAINQYLERDIDKKMRRTRRRPLPSESIEPRRALVFGAALGVAGFVWLAALVNLLAAWLAVSAIVFYVVVYTVWLKRTTPQNIVIGGAAGAVPVLVGWAAVSGTVGAPAWVLFAIIFLWTPPHFWALAVKYRDDYAAAGIPMLPVVRGIAGTTVQILVYAIVLVPVTLVLSPVAGMGAVYGLTALALGAGFLYLAVRLWRSPSTERALGLFKYSVGYLAILFVSMAADRLIVG